MRGRHQYPGDCDHAHEVERVELIGAVEWRTLDLHELVAVAQEGEELKVSAKDQSRQAGALAGTFRSLFNNRVVGVKKKYYLFLNNMNYDELIAALRANPTDINLVRQMVAAVNEKVLNHQQ